ncbi:MAG: methyltransferase domain-containing protein [Thermoplasmata archaeon]|nr:methyltransferase domain-containing protein [Thermoplasmata archaeon]
MSLGSPSDQALRILTPQGPVPLGFAREGNLLYLVARERSARWPVTVLREGRAQVELPEGAAVGAPELIVDPNERSRVLALFRTKYGPDQYARWYDHPARILRVRFDPTGAMRAGPTPGRERYYDWLSAEFDNVADEYDGHILGNRMNRWLRDRSLAWLVPRFRGRTRVLEIGCGSGMETLPLLRAGHRMTCVDISERMLAVVRAKAVREGLGDQLETRLLRAGDLADLLHEVGPSAFDAAYSTYGALNCEPDLASLPQTLHELLVPGGPFVAGVYNRWCLFELAGYTFTMQGDRALGRRRNPILVGASRFCVDVYAYSPTDFRRLFRPRFTMERLEGVPVLLPPSDLTGYAERFARHFDQLGAADAWLGRRWPWYAFGDHFLMTLVRSS